MGNGFLRFLFAATLVLNSALVSATTAPPDAAQQADEIVANYRKIIVLTSNQDSLDAVTRDHVAIVGKMLFQQNEEQISALSAALTADQAALAGFLDRLEKEPDYHDADKLVFRDMLDDLAATLAQNKDKNAALMKRVADDLSALDQIQALYQKELANVFSQIRTRGMPVRREAWREAPAARSRRFR